MATKKSEKVEFAFIQIYQMPTKEQVIQSVINKINTVPAFMELTVLESKFTSAQNLVLYFADSEMTWNGLD